MAGPPPPSARVRVTDKATLRRQIRAARAALPRLPIPVPEQFAARLAPGLVVAAYLPIGGEADPIEFTTAARASGCSISLPHVVDRATPMMFLSHDEEAPLKPGPFGLSQPHIDAEATTPDIILTPLVAFDTRGNRIGQGAGHYDRAFAAFPDAWRVGIAWSIQQVPAIVPDPWDIPLNAVATETHWITP